VKPSGKPSIIDDRKRSVSPDTLGDASSDRDEDDLDALRRKFVGEIDLPECQYPASYLFAIMLRCLSPGEEPLLKESRRRFVLFPIQYHEASPSILPSMFLLTF